MGIRLQQDNDGKIRENWWGRICIKGRRRDTDLKVPVEGQIPRDANGRISLALTGDKDFERSRKLALKAFARWRTECRKDPAELQRKAYVARTGDSLDGVPLSKLAELWIRQKRTYTPTGNWQKAVRTWLSRFCTFATRYAAAHNVKCETINDITPDLVRAWFDNLKSDFTWETVSKQMSLMRSAYRRYATGGRVNPFEDIVMRNREIGNRRVNHKPLTAIELEKLFTAAESDVFLYPLIVCAACTGMRIGDVCLLQKESVDLANGLIDVVTAKAGIPATIPIFSRLRPILDRTCTIQGDGQPDSPFVFPQAAAVYQRNPDALYKEVKLYFAQAITSPKNKSAVLVGSTGAPIRIDEALETAPLSRARRERIRKVYDLFKSGTKSMEIATTLGCSRSQVSMDLREAEKLTGENLRPRAQAAKARASKQDLLDKTRAGRAIGQRQASVYGWHSLRATFVVLAHEAGVPLADIQRIVGHTTTDMTLQYFNPTKIHAAERVRRQLRGTVLNPQQPQLPAPATIPPEVWAILTDEQKAILTNSAKHTANLP